MSSPEAPTPPSDPGDKDIRSEIRNTFLLAGNLAIKQGRPVTKEEAETIPLMEYIFNTQVTKFDSSKRIRETRTTALEELNDKETIGKTFEANKKFGKLKLQLQIFICEEKIGIDEEYQPARIMGYLAYDIIGSDNKRRTAFDDIVAYSDGGYRGCSADVVDVYEGELQDTDDILGYLGYSRDELPPEGFKRAMHEFGVENPGGNKQLLHNIQKLVSNLEHHPQEWEITEFEGT